MFRYSLLGLMVVAGLTVRADEAPSDADQIKALIPVQTAIDRRDFEKVALAQSLPKASQFKDQSLSWVLFCTDSDQLKDAGDQFRYVGRPAIRPSTLAREMYRSIGNTRILTAPVTMIHADRITEFEVNVVDDRATGTFAFEVPDLYEGKADFVANRRNGFWLIDELMMPKLKIHIVRDAEGVWSHKMTEEASDDKSE